MALIDTENLLQERLGRLYLQAPIANVAVIVAALLFLAFLHPVTGLQPTAIWAGSLASLALVRLLSWRNYLRNPSALAKRDWLRRYVWLNLLFGLAWSGIYLLVPPDAPLWAVASVFMLYFGVTMTAYAVLAVHLPGFVAYTFPSWITFTAMLVGFDSDLTGIAIAAAVFYAMAMLFALNLHRQTIRTAALKLNNQRLIERLQREVNERDRLVAEQTRELADMHHEVSQSEAQLKNVISGANLGFWDWDYSSGGHLVNDRWLEMLGLDRSDIDNHVSDWDARIHPDDRQRMIDLVGEHIHNRTGYVAEFRMRHKDGHWVWIEGSGAVVEYDEEGAAIRLSGTHQEISERRALQQQLAYQASHDALTGLLNRGELWERLDVEISRSQRHDRPLAVFMVDIDHFKQINDRHGHKVGDQVLQLFAETLKRSVRRMDQTLRYGGEEFIVILPETGIKDAADLAERLRTQVERQVSQIGDNIVRFTVSIGCACYPQHAVSASTLIDVADRALYRAKHNGRNRVEMAQPVDFPEVALAE